MGVPITFTDKFNPEKFEILGKVRYKINEKQKYVRLL